MKAKDKLRMQIINNLREFMPDGYAELTRKHLRRNRKKHDYSNSFIYQVCAGKRKNEQIWDALIAVAIKWQESSQRMTQSKNYRIDRLIKRLPVSKMKMS